MIKKIIILLLAFNFSMTQISKADEGMWLPMFIKRLNEADMQKSGLQLTAEEIYNINNSSLKDAVVSFGGFCTGELVSPDGLLFTNLHCGLDYVQNHSSVKDDYLTNGFWAMNKAEELSNPGLTVSFLLRMDDMSSRIKSQLTDTMSETTRSEVIIKTIKQIQDENSEKGKYKVEVKSFLHGNEFYMFVYEVYKDVRLVGAPPKAIGKFGRDTDNWTWPRHQADFSIFRVYMSPDGKPAEYSKDNIPYRSKQFLKINLAGLKPDDFTMILGYPGRTDRFRFSEGVKMDIEQNNPAIVKIRTERLNIIKSDMQLDDKVRIMYDSKYSKISNYWKYFIGATAGIKRMNVVEKRVEQEKQFDEWLNTKPEYKQKYGKLTTELTNDYKALTNYGLARVYYTEAFLGVELLNFANKFSLIEQVVQNKNARPEEIAKIKSSLTDVVEDFFNEYNESTDQKVCTALLEMYSKDVPLMYQSPYFISLQKKYGSDFKKLTHGIFKSSIFVSKAEVQNFLNNPSDKVLLKDPAFKLFKETADFYNKNVRNQMSIIQSHIDKNMRLYVEGLELMFPEKKFYPDANSTMRLTYGKVAEYYPRDAVYYKYYTTTEGILEKMDDKIKDFFVPLKFKEMVSKKDFGVYSDNGVLKVDFITTTDITGGNSGSPVLNSKGELIGVAFDGNWEAMSGDIAYDPEYKRTICVDIRYLLWVVDKYAGAGYLLNEMKIVR